MLICCPLCCLYHTWRCCAVWHHTRKLLDILLTCSDKMLLGIQWMSPGIIFFSHWIGTLCVVSLCQYFGDIFPEVIQSQKCHMNVDLILTGYGAVDVACCDVSAHAWAYKDTFKWKSLWGHLESITYEHGVRRLQELSMVPACINDPDVLLHSIVSCVRMDIQARQSLWTFIWLIGVTLKPLL